MRKGSTSSSSCRPVTVPGLVVHAGDVARVRWWREESLGGTAWVARQEVLVAACGQREATDVTQRDSSSVAESPWRVGSMLLESCVLATHGGACGGTAGERQAVDGGESRDACPQQFAETAIGS